MNKLSLLVPLYSHFRKVNAGCTGYTKRQRQRGNKRAQLNFINFPSTKKPSNKGPGQKDPETKPYIYITELANFSSRARPTTKREKLALLGEDGNTKTRGPLPAITGPDTSARRRPTAAILPLPQKGKPAVARIQEELPVPGRTKFRKDEIFIGRW